MILQILALAAGFVVASANPTPSSTSPSPPRSPTPEVITSQPEAVTSRPVDDIFSMSVFRCGDLIFGESVNMAFPPTETAIEDFFNMNATEVYSIFDSSVNRFCEKVNFYSFCVDLFTAFEASPYDKQVKQYIDMSKFGKALNNYCENINLVKDEFMCTLETVKRGEVPCQMGGVAGIVSQVGVAMKFGISKAFYCQRLSTATACRVQQLSRCSATYATLMKSVYDDLTLKYCLVP